MRWPVRSLFLFVHLLAILFCLAAIGIQDEFKSLLWLTTIPPIIILAVFKIFIKRRFGNVFRYYIPTEEELRMAKKHSGDLKGHRLEKRFMHPAISAELFTTTVRAKSMNLLDEVYDGKLGPPMAMKLQEYGGQKVQVRVVEGNGLMFAAIDDDEIEYDPAQYQRERDELDSDTRSVASSNNFLREKASIAGSERTLLQQPQQSRSSSSGSFDPQPHRGLTQQSNSTERTLRSQQSYGSLPGAREGSLPPSRPYTPQQQQLPQRTLTPDRQRSGQSGYTPSSQARSFSGSQRGSGGGRY